MSVRKRNSVRFSLIDDERRAALEACLQAT